MLYTNFIHEICCFTNITTNTTKIVDITQNAINDILEVILAGYNLLIFKKFLTKLEDVTKYKFKICNNGKHVPRKNLIILKLFMKNLHC